jgi:hypothetical protein
MTQYWTTSGAERQRIQLSLSPWAIRPNGGEALNGLIDPDANLEVAVTLCTGS